MHANVRVKKVLPWWLRRYVLLMNDEAEPQLYYFEGNC
jgi:hypothetical protein